MSLPFISVVIPCLNAQKTISDCVISLYQLDYPRDRLEVLIVDGMSEDKTRQIIYKNELIRVVDNPQKRVVNARNIGFEQARGEFIAFTDADCTFDNRWLANSLKYFYEDSKVACVGGANLISETDSSFAKAVGKVFSFADLFNAGASTRVFDKPIENRSHGSNAIYRKSALEKVMPVDETMTEGEDVLMNDGLTKLGYTLLYVPDVLVYHHRQTNPKAFFKQMMRYGKAKLWLKRRGCEFTRSQQLIGLFGWLMALPASIISMLVFRSFFMFLAVFLFFIGYSIGFLKEGLKR